jgi:hypothetical protein
MAAIPLRTIRDFHAQKHALGLYCGSCERWTEANLSFLIRTGWGDLSVSEARFRCRECGEVAEKQVRPPVPRVGGAAAYIGYA